MQVIKISLNEDLWEKALTLPQEKALFVFPTRAAAGYASRLVQEHVGDRQVSLLSMEDFEEAVMLPDEPVLSDEKRLLCLYLVLSDAQRESLHISSYDDIVEWGKRFFDFFEELAEEMVDVGTLPARLQEGNFNWLLWQEHYLDTILQIRDSYQAYISALGFTDRIFYLHKSNVSIPWQNTGIVFVNQYYYSALHKELLQALENAGNDVSLVFQALELAHQGEDWQVSEFDLAVAWGELKQKPRLRIVECENEDQMALAFLGDLQAERFMQAEGVIIDSSFHSKPYRRLFDPLCFRHPHSISICETAVFQVLTAVVEGLQSMQEHGLYLPLTLLSKWFACAAFVRYFAGGESSQLVSELLTQLQEPLQQDYLYLDEEYFQALPDGLLKRVGLGYTKLIQSFGAISSIRELCQLLDNPEGLNLSLLITPDEAAKTTILQEFWQQVANFKSIESLGLVKQWSAVFGTEACALPLLQLFMHYLKSAKLSYQTLEPAKPDWEISNLLDSRNRSLDQVVFFQLVEGLLPSAPTPVWLFSEAQRKRLKLKNYNDIRAWERYYFFRLLLCSHEAVCYTHRNLERDISPSSFIGELRFVLSEAGETLLTETIVTPMELVYQQRIDHPETAPLKGLRTPETCCLQSPLPQDFFIIPVDAKADFGSNRVLSGSVSSVLAFLRNPFLWYLETKCRLNPIPFEAEETTGSKLFGNIMHAYFARILGEYRGQHAGIERLDQLFGDSQYLQNSLTELIKEGNFRYQIPRNYNGEFLAEIISLRLADSIAEFYNSWLKPRLDKFSFTLIPECADMTDTEKLYQRLGTVAFQGVEYAVQTRGKADLRIETDTEAMIIDFKTGTKDINQLILYEWLYYLHHDLWPEQNITSIFWQIMDSEPSKDKITPEKRTKLLTSILDNLSLCLSEGYLQGRKTSDRQRLINITRSDLYQQNKESNHA